MKHIPAGPEYIPAGRELIPDNKIPRPKKEFGFPVYRNSFLGRG